MKVTFPHMGNTHIAIKALLKGLKLEVIPPPPVTNRTLELGIKYSPEFACLPLKINIGNFIEAIENGADTIIMAGGWGPCRFGYYAQVQRDILYDLGYEFNMYILEAPDFKITELFNQIKGLAEKVTFFEAIKAVKFAWYKINAVEILEKKFEYILPRSTDKDLVERLYKESLEAVDLADDKKAVDMAVKTYIKKLDSCPLGDHEILKIGLIGEIYTILEPSSNYNIIQLLGRLNAEVTRSVYTSDWVNDHLLKGLVKKSNRKQIISCASPYLNYWVGGHGQETVGYAVEFARQGYDGLIQIGPLTCMPEIVAQSVLCQVREVENIPCMTLYFDEHSGIAGISTRLEAFIDMLARKNTAQEALMM